MYACVCESDRELDGEVAARRHARYKEAVAVIGGVGEKGSGDVLAVFDACREGVLGHCAVLGAHHSCMQAMRQEPAQQALAHAAAAVARHPQDEEGRTFVGLCSD